MSELSRLLFHPLSNAIMTILTGFTAFYWIFTMIAGDWFGDTDVHVHAHTDVHLSGADLDTHTHGDAHDATGDHSIFHQALEYINIGKMPFMIVYSIFKFTAWIVTLTTSVIWGLASWGWKSVFILLPVFAVAFVITRYATKPLVKFYNTIGYNGEEAYDLMGRTARMRSSIKGNTIGAAELKVQSDVIRILVKSKTGEPLDYNTEVMITDESADKKFYLVVPEINLNNIV